MRRLAGTAALALSLALALGACSTPAAIATPSSTPAEPTPALTPVGPSAAGGGSGNLVARNIAFEPTLLAVPAGGPIVILFENADAGIPHNVHVTGPAGDVIKSELITGPATQELSLGALPSGNYPFVCDVHPNMTGTIRVG